MSRRLARTLIALTCGFLFFYGLAAGPLYKTEGLRALVAAEMLREGRWLVPIAYGEPLLTKPPLGYLAIVLASLPFGAVHPWTARLPSAIAASVVVVLFYHLFRRPLGRSAGVVAALTLPASVLWLDKVPSADLDMLQLAWVAGSLFCLHRAIEASEATALALVGQAFQPDVGPRSQAGKPDLRDVGPRSQAGKPDLRDVKPRSQAGKPDLRDVKPRSQAGKPDLRGRYRWWILALLCVAGGVLTKWTAPAFFYLTALPLLAWRGRLSLLWRPPHLLAAGLGAALCLAWIGVVVANVGWPAFRDTVGGEALSKLVPGQRPTPYPWNEVVTHPLLLVAAQLPWSGIALVTWRPGFARLWDERGRRLLQLLHCWAWPNLIFWSVVPVHTARHSLPLIPALSGLAALVWVAWQRGLLRWPLPQSPWRVLTALLAVWIGVKLVFVHVIVPRRNNDHHPEERAGALAALVPAGFPLYVCRVKDETLLFYTDRVLRRLERTEGLHRMPELLYCIVSEAEWKAWPQARPAEVVGRVADTQGTPVVVVRVPALTHGNPE